MDQETGAPRAFEFTGNWREFAPIAFTNLLLTIVTLGIYAFWARTRVRHYLWSRTRFIDERLEWTGTGLELFIGYIMAFVLFIVPLAVMNLVLQGMVMRGHPGLAGLIVVFIYIFLVYLTGVAIFRAIRYRLSRTFWHGIRGGSNDQGIAYGFAHLWRSIVGAMVLGLMVPWSMTSRWNLRWGAMSFGPYQFEANANWNTLFGRFLLFYLAPILLFIVGALGAAFGMVGGGEPGGMGVAIGLIAGLLIFYVGLGVIALSYYAAYYREAIGNLALGELEFAFTARTKDWLKLTLGNIGLVIVTLGIGYIFIAYRNWAFFMRHLDAYGELDLDSFTQSTTREPGQGEGLLDAFDIGAF